jgi:hypothetical protein
MNEFVYEDSCPRCIDLYGFVVRGRLLHFCVTELKGQTHWHTQEQGQEAGHPCLP